MGCGPWGKSRHLTLAGDPIPREVRAALTRPRNGLAGFSPICPWLPRKNCAPKVDQGGVSNIPQLVQTHRWLETPCLWVCSKWHLRKSPPAHSSAPSRCSAKMNVGSASHVKTVQAQPDLWALGPIPKSYSFSFDPNSSTQKNVKEFYSSHPPPQKMEWYEEKKTNGEICENGCLRLHLQTERGNLSEFKLPYKVSLHSGRDALKCTFWPKFPFISPLGSLSPTFYPIFPNLRLSLWFHYVDNFITQVGRNLNRNHHGCKRTAFSELNSLVQCIHTHKTASFTVSCSWGWCGVQGTAWRGHWVQLPWWWVLYCPTLFL